MAVTACNSTPVTIRSAGIAGIEKALGIYAHTNVCAHARKKTRGEGVRDVAWTARNGRHEMKASK